MYHRLGLVSQLVPCGRNSLAERKHQGLPRRTELFSDVVAPAGTPWRSHGESGQGQQRDGRVSTTNGNLTPAASGPAKSNERFQKACAI